MTGHELRRWRHKTHPIRVVELEGILGVTARTIYSWEALGDDDIPQTAALACAAITLGVHEYDGRPLAKRERPLRAAR